jgi:hypothetical protein
MGIVQSISSFIKPKDEVIVQPKTESETLMDAYDKALTLINEAKSHFNHAEPDFIEAAVLEIAAREAQLNSIIKKIKEHSIKTGFKTDRLKNVE